MDWEGKFALCYMCDHSAEIEQGDAYCDMDETRQTTLRGNVNEVTVYYTVTFTCPCCKNNSLRYSGVRRTSDN
jgi:hypothetical protein